MRVSWPVIRPDARILVEPVDRIKRPKRTVMGSMPLLFESTRMSTSLRLTGELLRELTINPSATNEEHT